MLTANSHSSGGAWARCTCASPVSPQSPGTERRAQWTLPDAISVEKTAVTAFQGITTFNVWEGRGAYRPCVIKVTRDEWRYEECLNREMCAEMRLLGRREANQRGPQLG